MKTIRNVAFAVFLLVVLMSVPGAAARTEQSQPLCWGTWICEQPGCSCEILSNEMFVLCDDNYPGYFIGDFQDACWEYCASCFDGVARAQLTSDHEGDCLCKMIEGK